MPGEIMMLQIGQCGNQVGHQFWKRICTEHGISPTGNWDYPITQESRDRKIFFYGTEKDYYKPRTVLIDLEPRVINSIMAEPDYEIYGDIYLPAHGSGSGNNWAIGYDHAQKNSAEIFDIIRFQAEGCDKVEGFMMCHAIAGGTGSGVGSHLLECLSEYYPKKLVQTYSVFPEQKKTSEVVIQPYNSLLTLRRLIDLADSVVILDNAALNHATTGKKQIEKMSYPEINTLATTIMSMTTSTLRFPSHSFNSLGELMAGLIKSPRLHFLIPGYAQLTPENQPTMKPFDLLVKLYKPGSILLSSGLEKAAKHRFISSLNFIEGKLGTNDRYLATEFIKSHEMAPFISWTPTCIQVAQLRPSPYLWNEERLLGVSLASHTGISKLLEVLVRQYEKLKHHSAFLQQFNRISEYDFTEDLASSCEHVNCLIEEYKAAKQSGYMQWSEDAANQSYC